MGPPAPARGLRTRRSRAEKARLEARSTGPREPHPPQGLQGADTGGIAADGLSLVLQAGVAEGICVHEDLPLPCRHTGDLLHRGGLDGQDIEGLLFQRLRRRSHREPRHRGCEQLYRHQQADQHHRPQGVAEAGTDPPSQRGPQGHHRQDQKAG